MLQTPISRPQPRPRPLSFQSDHQPILEAKQDPRHRISRPTTPLTACPQRVASKRPHQHRRQLSVPDHALASLGGNPNYGMDINVNFNLYAYKPAASDFAGGMLQAGVNGTSEGGMIHDPNSAFHQPRRPTTPPQLPNEFQPITPRSPFVNSIDHSGHHHRTTAPPEHRNASSHSPLIDVDFFFDSISENRNGEPLGAPNGFNCDNVQRAPDFAFAPAHGNLPSPPHTGQFRAVSTFDLAPIPNTNFINMATLGMPLGDDIESDRESFHSAQAEVTSPTFAPAKSSPAATRPGSGSFENQMPSVPEEKSTEVVENKQAPTKVASPSPNPAPATVKGAAAIPGELEPSLVPQPSGITLEEIASYIAGPEPSDGKWVCLYPECGKRFGRKENIKSHVQTHLGDRQYRCTVCLKCFVRQHDLKRHAKIHTGVKPHPCACGNAFARQDALTRHRQRGMCIGAFEGIVKKMAKRGRPRKRPLEEGEEPKAKKSNKNKGAKSDDVQSSGASSSGSSSCGSEYGADVQTPRDFNFDFSATTPVPETRASSPYIKDSGSATDLSQPNHSAQHTPPTSPPELGSYEHYRFLDANHKSGSFSSQSEFDYGDFTFSAPHNAHEQKYVHYASSGHSTSTAEEDEFWGSNDGTGFLELTTLERDPGILGALANSPSFVKPEALSSST